VLNLNSIINHYIRKSILSDDDLSAYIAKYVIWYIYIAINVDYFTINYGVGEINFFQKKIYINYVINYYKLYSVYCDTSIKWTLDSHGEIKYVQRVILYWENFYKV